MHATFVVHHDAVIVIVTQRTAAKRFVHRIANILSFDFTICGLNYFYIKRQLDLDLIIARIKNIWKFM